MMQPYSKLTIKQFLNCKRIAEMELDPLDKSIRLLSEISGKTQEQIEDMPIVEMKAQLKELYEIEHLNENSKVNMNIKVNGERFRVVWELTKLTAAQYIEVAEWTKDPAKIIYNIHKILASLVVRRTWYGKTKKRDATEHKYIADLFYNNMKIEQAYPIMLFFCRYSEALHDSMLTYLAEQAVKLTREAQEMIIGQSGDGLRS